MPDRLRGLSITSVHPMREDAVREFLERAHADWSVMKRLMQKGRIVRVSYEEKNFYIRRLHRRTEG